MSDQDPALPTREHTKLLARAEDAVLAIVNGEATVFPSTAHYRTAALTGERERVVYVADHALACEYLTVLRQREEAGVPTLDGLTAMLQMQTALRLDVELR